MKDLLGVFESVGCTKLEAYIQSGNVLFDASAALLKKVPVLVADALQAKFDIAFPSRTMTGEAMSNFACSASATSTGTFFSNAALASNNTLPD